MADISKYYFIFTQEIHSVGGMQLYTAGKSKYLEEAGWKTVVFHPDYSKRGCAYSYLDRYEVHACPIIELPPVAYSSRIVSSVTDWMHSFVDDTTNSIVYVESQYDIAALWAEEFAKSVGGIHINFNCNEIFRGNHKIYPYVQDFFWFKYCQHALYGLRPDTICKIFEGYRDVDPDESTLFDAVEPDPIQDIEDSRIEQIKKADYTIMYLGRIVKGYVPNIIKGVAGFANKYTDKKIQFCIVGDAGERKLEIENTFSRLTNVSIVYMGDMVPILRALYDKVDVVIAGAVCAEVSARCGVPTIVADCGNYNANGVLGYTVHNSMYYEEEHGQTDFATALVETLINKSYLNYPYTFPEPKPVEEIYSEHIKMYDRVEREKGYFDIESIKVPINYRKAALLQIIRNCIIKKR